MGIHQSPMKFLPTNKSYVCELLKEIISVHMLCNPSAESGRLWVISCCPFSCEKNWHKLIRVYWIWQDHELMANFQICFRYFKTLQCFVNIFFTFSQSHLIDLPVPFLSIFLLKSHYDSHVLVVLTPVSKSALKKFGISDYTHKFIVCIMYIPWG